MGKDAKTFVDFDAVKRAVDIVEVVRSYGVELKRQGRDYRGLCPFHPDTNPSLSVTRSTGLYRCTSPSCAAAGDAIRFVATHEKLTDREAAIKLHLRIPGMVRASELLVSKKKEAAAELPEHRRRILLGKVARFYSEQLFGEDRTGYDYLSSRGLDDQGLLKEFEVGYCNGKLPLTKNGRLVPDLKTIGVLTPSGTERFQGMIVVPIRDADGHIVNLYGRRIGLCEKHERHMLLPGARRGVFCGPTARQSYRLLMVEGAFDALSLCLAGITNVMALLGAEGFTEDHAEFIKTSGTRELIALFDGDEGGRAGVQRLEEKLVLNAETTFRAVTGWPEDIEDANALLVKLGRKGTLETITEMVKAKPASEAPEVPSPAVTSVQPAAPVGSIELPETQPCDGGFYVNLGSRRYQLTAIEKPSPSRLRAMIRANKPDPANPGGRSRFHLDTVDFYLNRSRRGFTQDAARLFEESFETVEADMNRIIELLDEHVAAKCDESKTKSVVPTGEERAAGIALGRNPSLVQEILNDFTALGMIGERLNKLVYYLGITSRKMDDPLAILTLSSSGAGKSHAQDTVLSMCPEEDLLKLTSLSGQALFYKGEESLKHKVLAVAEEAGAGEAHYALRSLISDKRLTIESTIKNVVTGRLETQMNYVSGPTAVFQTTTNPDTDAETRSRFIILSVDESPEQTRAILERQRQSHTLAGLRARARREAILRRHHAFQRLLQPVKIMNPYEPLLTFEDERLPARRENPKYLNLILAVTFLHQMQRPLRRDPESGLEYIETTLEDIALANEIAGALFGHSTDDLSRPARQLLTSINSFVAAKCKQSEARVSDEPKLGGGKNLKWTRRELREAIGWNDTRLRTHLDELTRMEYVVPLSGRFGQTYYYRLTFDPNAENPRVPGLKSVEQLACEWAELAENAASEAAPETAVVNNLAGENSNLAGENSNLAGENSNLAGENANLAPTSQVESARLESPVSYCESDPNQPYLPNLAGVEEMYIENVSVAPEPEGAEINGVALEVQG